MLCVVGYLLGRGRILCKILMLGDDNLVGKKGSFIIIIIIIYAGIDYVYYSYLTLKGMFGGGWP